MSIIGRFSRNSDGSYIGEIITLSVQAKNVRIVPEQNTLGRAAPEFRVMVGSAEIGVGRRKIHTGGGAYVAINLDDPSFAQPIYARLSEADEEGAFNLLWLRQEGRFTDDH